MSPTLIALAVGALFLVIFVPVLVLLAVALYQRNQNAGGLPAARRRELHRTVDRKLAQRQADEDYAALLAADGYEVIE